MGDSVRVKVIAGKDYYIVFSTHAQKQAKTRSVLFNDVFVICEALVGEIIKNIDTGETFVIYSPVLNFSFSCEFRSNGYEIVITTVFAPGLQRTGADQIIFEYSKGKPINVKFVDDYMLDKL